MEQFTAFLEALPVKQFIIVNLVFLLDVAVLVLLFGRERVSGWVSGALKQVRLLPDETKE